MSVLKAIAGFVGRENQRLRHFPEVRRWKSERVRLARDDIARKSAGFVAVTFPRTGIVRGFAIFGGESLGAEAGANYEGESVSASVNSWHKPCRQEDARENSEECEGKCTSSRGHDIFSPSQLHSRILKSQRVIAKQGFLVWPTNGGFVQN